MPVERSRVLGVWVTMALACCSCGGDSGSGSGGSGGVGGNAGAGGTGASANALSVEFAAVSELSSTAWPGGPTLLVASVTAAADATVTMSATADPDVTREVLPTQLSGPGAVEVFFRPEQKHVGQTVSLTVHASTGNEKAEVTRLISVGQGGEGEPAYADELLQSFLTHLASAKPQTGLTPTSKWIESFPTFPGIVIVVHRTYLTDTWDLHLSYHAMVAPYDWARLEVRRRDKASPEVNLCFPSQISDRTVKDMDLTGDDCAAK